MKAKSTAEDIARQLGGSAKAGSGYKCRCPAHDDKNPSLSVWDRPDGSVGFKCYAGCSSESIWSALAAGGLLPRAKRKFDKNASNGSRRAAVASNVITPVPSEMPPPFWNDLAERQPDKIYEYRTSKGGLFGVVARWDGGPDGKKVRPFLVVDDGGPKWKSLGFPEPRPLYRGDLLGLHPSSKVLVVEGEKAADRAADLFPDYVVVTWQGGANAIAKTDWSLLSGREV
ncbi:MAG TPA: hypothetical protein VGN98_01875, partial [Tianweitania sediminis]|nr:hypothetical protein [Tianweitania sediminis]